MNSSDRPAGNPAGARGGDRRRKDRRKEDRRSPVPLWRRPWAYVAYGVAGALVVLLLFSIGDEPAESPAATTVGTRTGMPEVDTSTAAGADAPVQDAHGTAGYAGLLAAGDAAEGRRVRTTLYCEPIRSVGLRRGSDMPVNATVAENADAAGRVPAAECRWGAEPSAPELLLIVPVAWAERFASTREVEQSFVRRREVPAEVVWIGRSDALALRNVAVLRAIGSAPR